MKLVLTSVAAALALTGLSACASMAPPPAGSTALVFSAADFAWSAVPGTSGIDARVAYRAEGRSWRCAGSVGLTPETPWTRQRFLTLYGSTERAALPAAVVRARSVSEASDDYRAYVRNTTCDEAGRLNFSQLPDGAWFLIAPVTADGAEPVVLMRRVTTRGGRVTSVTLD